MINKRKIFLSCFLVVHCTLYVVQCFSQSYNFKNYSVEQGLPFVQAYTIFQDSKGNLWSGGGGGLSKFDGKFFTNYSPKNGLTNHWVTSIAEDKEGNIWIGTVSGLNKLEGEEFTTFTTKDGLAGDYITSLTIGKNGNLWIATTNGIVIYDGKLFTSFTTKSGLNSNNISLIFADKNEDIWIGTDQGVSKIIFLTNHTSQGQSFTSYSLINGIYNAPITCITQDNSGNIWMGTDSGVVKYDGTNFKTFTVKEGLLHNAIKAVENDRYSDGIWVGTLKGLNKIFEGKPSETYHISEIKNGNKIHDLFTDNEDNLWIGTYNGLYRFRDKSFSTFTEKDGLLNTMIFPVFRDNKKNLWIGTDAGRFYVYDGKSFKYYSEKDGLLGSTMYAGMQAKDGSIWIGTNAGLSIYANKTFRNFHGKKDGLKSDSVTAIIQDSKGRIWLGGNKGVTVWDGNKFRSFELKTDEKNFDVWFLFEDSRGIIWLGTYIGGLFRHDPSLHGEDFNSCENFSKTHKLKSQTFLSVTEDKEGNLYLGSFDGVYIYNPNTEKISIINEKDGLSSDLVYVMIFDKEYEHLFIGTNQGVNKFDVKEYKRSGRVELEQYSKQDGFSGVETNSSGIWRDEDGTIWFGTVNGLVRYNFNEYLKNHAESKTSIKQMRLFYKDTLLLNNAELPYYLNNISFEYIGICLTNPDKVKYKVMLQGFDAAWSPETKETVSRYSNLAPGKYVFKVMSCNNEELWNKEPATVSFTILPPAWATWWFRISVTILLVFLIVLFSRLRSEAIRKKEAEKLNREIQLAHNELKALRSQMDPHFIFNSLSSIQSFIMTKDEESALRYLNKFAKLMRMILLNSEKPSITIQQEFNALRLYLELEALRWENKFEYAIEVNSHIEPDFHKIPSMLIQPYVENAINHGVVPKMNGKGKIEIKILKDDTHIICSITDNGIGRKKSHEHKVRSGRQLHESVGMKITAERLEVLNRIHRSDLSVQVTDMEDEKNNPLGTKVEIFIPIT